MKETIEFDGKRLSVVIEHPTQAGRGYALSLHGGGLSTKEATDYLADCFTARGLGWVSFDFSGWGESSGERDDCSLAGRLDDALAVVRHYGLTLDYVIGTSMGGYVAVKLLEQVSTRNLVLFCPAAYATSAWALKFGHGFTEDIRRQDSFLETDAIKACADYTGNVLYIVGDHDEVIPPAVERIYRESFRQASTFREVLLDDCPHPIHRWAAGKPDILQRIRAELSQFIETTANSPD